MDKVSEIIEKGNKLYENGYLAGGSGNISFRDLNNLFITRSGSCLGDLTQEDVLFLPLDEDFFQSKRRGRGVKPSIEGKLHIKTYQKTDKKSIIHSHPTYASVLSKKTDTLDVTEEAYFTIKSEEVPVIQNYKPGSDKLADEVSNGLVENNGVVVENHGVFAASSSLDQALKINEVIEDLSKNLFLNL